MTTTYRVVTATLKARTAIHIGSGAGNEMTDDLIRRDAQGAPIIPGTAIAGALRALLTRLGPRLGARECSALTGKDESCRCGVCHLFGDVNPKDEEHSESAASRVLVFDARLVKNGQPITERVGGLIRDGVGIERASGAAARAGAVKFDLEVLPAGTEFQLRLELRDADDQDEQLLAAGLVEWEYKRMWLGGRVARGLGAFDLTALKFVELDLSKATQLMTFLNEDEPWRKANVVTERLRETRVSKARGCIENWADTMPQATARRWVQATFVLQADGFFLTNDAVSSAVSGFDHAPLLAKTEDWQHPVLTGAGLRGVLRSHAERIARTLATSKAKDWGEFKFTCPACDPNAKGSKTDRVEMESCDTLLLYQAGLPGDKNAEVSQLCLACRLFGSTRRGSRLLVEDAPLIGEPQYKMLDFLAIDRFTGGGGEGLKFDALALWKPSFQVRLFLDNPEKWELGWLALVLRDLWEGWLTVGFGAAKGFGQVHIAPAGWQLRLGYLTDSDFSASATLAKSQNHDGVYRYAECRADDPGNHKDWLTLAETWVKQFGEECDRFQRVEKMDMPKDSYFGQDELTTLYPKEVSIP